MAELDHLDMDKVRQVRVVSTLPDLHFLNTTYLDEDGSVWRIENGIVQVREISLTGHPDTDFQPKWKPVIQEENAAEVVVYDWPLENELDREKI